MLLNVTTLEKDKSQEEEQDDHDENHGNFVEDLRLTLDLLIERLQAYRAVELQVAALAAEARNLVE